MRKLLSLLLAFVMLASLPFALGEGAGETPVFHKAWVSGPHYGYAADVSMLALTNDPLQERKTEADFAGEIFFYPYNEQSGLYETGQGEPAGDRAEVRKISDNRVCWIVHLNEPGKYVLSGAAYYLLDPGIPAQASIREELDGAVLKCSGKKEAQMVKSLHDWTTARVSPVFPEEDSQRLNEACADPMNALITGYARPEAYAGLMDLLTSRAGLFGITVSGTADGQETAWNLCRQEGEWFWTDAAMDDRNDKKSAKWLGKDDASFAKDHILNAEDASFTETMIRTTAIDALMNGTLSASQYIYYQRVANLEYLVCDGPAYMVGDSAEVSFRVISCSLEEYQEQPPEVFFRNIVSYQPWDEENLWHFSWAHVPGIWDSEITIEEPEPEELYSITALAEDRSSFTLTFHRPGKYMLSLGVSSPVTFLLISPSATEAVKTIAEMDKAVESAKQAPSEKAAAQMLSKWIISRVKYNHIAWEWWKGITGPKTTERDLQTAWDPIGGLIYGKLVCGGYATLYNLLMRQAGLTDFYISGQAMPSLDEHAWNLNRLDGEWSVTDVTWKRFAWPNERMRKDHEPFDPMVGQLFFGNFADLLEARMENEFRLLSALPPQLKVLPSRVEDYGFPDHPPKFIDIGVELQDNRVTVNAGTMAKFFFHMIGSSGLHSDDLSSVYNAPYEKAHSVIISSPDRFQVEVHTDKNTFFSKKPSQWILLDYENGERTGARFRSVIPDREGIYPGYHSRYHYYEYDKDMNPSAMGWYMVSPRSDALEVRVNFSAEGRAEKYEVRYRSGEGFARIQSVWSGTPDRPITRLNGKDLEDPAEADPRICEPILFSE